MNTIEHLRVLFEELAAKSEAIDSVTRQGDRHWTLSCLEQHLAVAVEFHEDDNLLTLRASFAGPAPEAQLQTYETMLRVNWSAADNNGLRLGLDEQANVIQEMDVPTPNLDVLQLRSYCEFFVTKVAFWTALMAQGGLEGDDEQTQEVLDEMSGPSPGAIRV